MAPLATVAALVGALASPAEAPTDGEPGDHFAVKGGGDGVRWTSGDRRYSMGLTMRAQMRYSADIEGASPTQSLQIRRARLKSTGWMFGEAFRYQLELGLSPRDMRFTENGARFTPLLDWFFEFRHLRDLTIRVGQSKLAYSLTRVQSSGNLQFVDRSPANGEFNLDRDIALDIRSYDFLGIDRLRYFAGVFLGEGRDARGPTSFEMGYFGRIEVYPLGDVGNHKRQVDFRRSPRARLMIAGAYAFLDGGARDLGTRGDIPEDGGTTDSHNATVDTSLKVAGFSLVGEGFYRRTRRIAPAALSPGQLLAPGRDGYGFSTQAGYLMGVQPVEFAARYGEVHPLRLAPIQTHRQPGTAVSWYVLEHAVKLQLDYHATVRPSETLGHTIRLQFQGSV